jgi:hypothetical protein
MNSDIAKELFKLRKGVIYRDSDHTYWKNGKKLISSTQLKERYKKEFDARYWSLYKVIQALPDTIRLRKNRRGYYVNDKYLSIEEAESLYSEQAATLREEWSEISNNAKKRGTLIHTQFEKAWMGEETGNKTIDKFCLSEIEKGWIPVAVELMVSNEDVAGRFDGLFYFEDKLYIRDVKTDKEIKYGNPYDRMKKPFNDLEDCNYNGYMLQLNIYKDIIEQGTDLEIYGLIIDHYRGLHIETIPLPIYNIPWPQLNTK